MSTTVPGRASVPSQHSPAPAGRPVIDVDAPPPATAAGTRTDTVRDAIHAGACVLAGVLITSGFVLDDTDDLSGSEAIAAVAASPDRFYWGNTLGAFGMAMLAAVGLAVLRLVRGRARVLATVGGVLLMIAGTAAAAGLFMYASMLTVMAESGLDVEVMGALEKAAGDSARPGLAFMIGFPGVFLGLLLCAAALAVSRVVWRWVPAALVAGTIAVLALGETSASFVGDVLLTAGCVGIGLALWRRTTSDRAAIRA